MIKYNKRLDLIDEYLPSNRLYDSNIKKLDWNECNLPFSKKITFFFFACLLESISINHLTLLTGAVKENNIF